MQAPARLDIQHALINVTRSERAGVAFPPDFDGQPWHLLDFYGWRDPKKPHVGYLVRELGDGLVAVALRAPENRMLFGRKAMCAICRAVDTASSIALFTARRTGPAGRKGDSVGTYICSGLDCSAQLRAPKQKIGRSMLSDNDSELDPDVLAAAMLDRLDGFLASVRST